MKVISLYKNNKQSNFYNKIPNTGDPVIYLLTETCLLRTNRPFFYPDFSKKIFAEADIALKVSRVGKNIPVIFAHRYYNEIGLSVKFTAMDIFEFEKEHGLPWMKSKCFEGSVAISKFINISNFKENKDIPYSFELNDNFISGGSTSEMVFSFDEIIAFVSQYFTLKMGDLIFTACSGIDARVKIGDKLNLYLDNKEMLDFLIK
ncbi:fumarylacetoacetate hydrolase family protein [Bacteroidota bacterium]